MLRCTPDNDNQASTDVYNEGEECNIHCNASDAIK